MKAVRKMKADRSKRQPHKSAREMCLKRPWCLTCLDVIRLDSHSQLKKMTVFSHCFKWFLLFYSRLNTDIETKGFLAVHMETSDETKRLQCHTLRVCNSPMSLYFLLSDFSDVCDLGGKLIRSEDAVQIKLFKEKQTNATWQFA